MGVAARDDVADDQAAQAALSVLQQPLQLSRTVRDGVAINSAVRQHPRSRRDRHRSDSGGAPRLHREGDQ